MEVKNIDEYVPRRAKKVYETDVCNLAGNKYYKYISEYSYDDRSSIRMSGNVLMVSDGLFRDINKSKGLVFRGKDKFRTLLIEYGLYKMYFYNDFDKKHAIIYDSLDEVTRGLVSSLNYVKKAISGRSIVTNVYMTKSMSAVVSELEFVFNSNSDMYNVAMLVSLNELSKCSEFSKLKKRLGSYVSIVKKVFTELDFFLSMRGNNINGD